MRKEYQAPDCEALELIVKESILAGSNIPVGGTGKPDINKRRNDWDNIWG